MNYNKNSLLETIIKKTYKHATDLTTETNPVKKMNYVHTLYLTSSYIDDVFDNMNELSQISILNSTLNIINFDIIDEYYLTHVLFFLSDFGELTINDINDINDNILDSHKIQNILLTLTAKSILSQDMDLLSEYIINLCNLNLRHNLCDLALNILIKSQYEDGSFPCPKRKKKISGNKQVSVVRNNYHATLVAIIAMIFMLKLNSGYESL